jgi:hypothetical protein
MQQAAGGEAGQGSRSKPSGVSAAPQPRTAATRIGHTGRQRASPAIMLSAVAPIPNTVQNSPSSPALPPSDPVTYSGSATSTGPYRKK